MDFAELYNAYKDRVYNLALQYVQNPRDAEEVSQDVFVKVHQKLDAFQQRSDVKTWIYRITVNTALDFCRARQRRKRSFLKQILSLDRDSGLPEPAHFEHPGALLEQKEALEFIFGCINRLSEKQRTVIILLRLEGLSQQETAAIMQLSVKAVESLLQRARQTLEKIMHENEGK